MLGYQFGVFYKTSPNKKWKVYSELNYSLIGSKIPYLSRSDAADTEYTVLNHNHVISYLEVLIGVQYDIHHFYVALGPSVAFRLFSKLVNVGKTTGYKAVDMSANLLTGYKITKKFDLNIRYSYGLLNTLKDEKLYSGYNTATLKTDF